MSSAKGVDLITCISSHCSHQHAAHDTAHDASTIRPLSCKNCNSWCIGMNELHTLHQVLILPTNTSCVTNACPAVPTWDTLNIKVAAGRPQTPLGSTARPGTSSGRPGSALRNTTLPTPPVAGPIPGIPVQEPQAGAGSSEANAARQMISSGRRVLPGARPASAGLKRPTSAAGTYAAYTSQAQDS